MPKGFLLVLCGFGMLISFGRCSKVNTVGLFTQSDLNSLNLDYVDTFTVKTSTIIFDSVPTVNATTALVGTYNDPKLGKVSAKSYFQLDLGTGFNLTTIQNPIKDSTRLVLYYNGSTGAHPPVYSRGSYAQNYYQYYGDTTLPVSLNVYRVTQDIKRQQIYGGYDYNGKLLPFFYTTFGNANPANTALSNTSKFNYLADSNLTFNKPFAFFPHPFRGDSVVVKLTGLVWDSLFTFAKTGSYQVTDPTEFQLFLKGLVLSSKEASCISSFDIVKSHLSIYYHYINGGQYTNAIQSFKINTSNGTTFNAISDSSNSILNNNKTFTNIDASLTDNETFVQSGVGIMTRVDFPYLNVFRQNHPKLTVNKAELIVEPVAGTFNPINPLPQSLILYRTNLYNAPIATLSLDFNPQGTQYSYLTFDPSYQSIPFYKFIIAQYTGALFNSVFYDGNNALLLGTSVNSLENSVERVILGGNNNPNGKIKLRVYYTNI